MAIFNFQAYIRSLLFYKNILALSVFILLFLAVFSYKNAINLTDSTELVVHTHSVHTQLEQVFSYVKDAESGQRGFILTRDTFFLEPYLGARSKVNQSITQLRTLTADNRQQQNNLDTLHQLIDFRFSMLENALKAASPASFNVSELRNCLIKGKTTMDNIRVKVKDMIDLEMNYLTDRHNKYKNTAALTPLFTLFFFLFSIFIFVIAYLKINKDLEDLKEANNELLITAETIKHAEKIGNFSIWRWDLQTNKLIYSDNQYTLLGCEPHSFEPTIENYMSFVHPDDLHVITGGIQESPNHQQLTAFFRIIRKDGAVRYFKSIGKILEDIEGKKIRIGVNFDVTEEHLINAALVEKNLELKQNNDNLLIATESTKQAEKIGQFSTWQWDLQTNKLMYSDNQYALLGLEPQSFEAKIENYMPFVYPDDRHLISERARDLEQSTEPISIFFRIMRQDGAVRYLNSVAKLFQDSEGKKTIIGTNIDITEQHLNNLALKENNLDLQQKNNQLIAFNNMASHDLQEPLRKIQTFISRISERDTETISESIKDYLWKIQASATRMRNLIDNLLLYSSTTKSEVFFKKSDLNVLLIKAQLESGHHIQEKNAVIESDELPVLNVIPFQIEQLFINLLSNSLKFSKPDTPPIIKINCALIYAKDYPNLKTDADKAYYKISVADNGWGFDPQYSETVFNIFNRLQRIDTKGTGIGLAICKKIVENHAGFITAEGVPDVGATFTIFLPA